MDRYKEITIKSYDKTTDAYSSHVKFLHPLKESRFFISLLNRGNRVLDLGCGSGRDSKIFADKGFKVTGVDLSSKMIKKARKEIKNAEFKVVDIEALKFGKNSFDGIWANASLLHIPKRKLDSVIETLSGILKNDGIMFIRVKSGDGESLEPDKRYGNVKKFWHYFKKGELGSILIKHKLKILKSYLKKRRTKDETHDWIIVFAQKSIL